MNKLQRLWAGTLIIGTSVLLVSCVAQQADVVRMKKALDARITKLDESKIALEKAVSDANLALGEANSIIATQHREIKELLAARAEVMDQVTTIKDGDLSEVRGALDQSEHHLQSVAQQVKELKREVVLTREEGVAREKKLQPVVQHLQKQMNQQNEVVTSQANKVAEFQASFVDFREALDTVRLTLKTQEEQWGDVKTQLKSMSNNQVEKDVVAQGNWEEMKQSVDSVVSAFEQVSQTLADRLDEHEQRLAQVFQTGIAAEDAPRINRTGSQERATVTSVQGLQQKIAHLAPTQGPGTAQSSSHSLRTQGALLEHQVAQGSLDKLDQSKIVANTASSYQRTLKRLKPNDHELALYRQNYEMLQSGDLHGAFQGFRHFLEQHPRSTLASNAQYWLGECYYGKRQYGQAIREFQRVLTSYPSSQKVPAALLKIGYSHLGLQDQKSARLMFRQLVRSHPKSRAAAKAYARLTEVDQSRKESS
ncbi:MAG: tol-pal system protein YbgF [Nitrospirales bacterium]